MEDGGLIEVNVAGRKLDIVGVNGQRKTLEEMEVILEERRRNWKPGARKYKNGVLRLFREHAVSLLKDAYMKVAN